MLASSARSARGAAAMRADAPRRTVDSHIAAHDLEAWVTGGLRVVDVGVVVLSALGAYLGSFWLRGDTPTLAELYVEAVAIVVIFAVNTLHIMRVYVFEDLARPTTQLGRVATGWILAILGLIAFAFLTQTSVFYSRRFFISWFLLGLGLFFVVRIVLWHQLDRWRAAGRFGLNVAIVGADEPARAFLRHLSTTSTGRYRVVGVFDDLPGTIGTDVEGFAVSGTLEDLIAFARTQPIDEIIVVVPWQDSDRLHGIVRALRVLPINVKMCPNVGGWTVPAQGFQPLAGIPMLSVLERPLSGWSLVLKAIEDRVLSAILLVLLAPVFALIALAIRLDSPGPVLFRQRRYGFNNNPIVVYKFRTMAHAPQDEANVPQATRDDPRVTRLGRLLRRTSLDELPQLLNVFKGEMSLVGPRPHAVAHNERYATIIDGYLSRHRVKPGITGWAQVNGLRGETDTPEKMRARVQHDLFYIDNWSLLFDLKILLLTPFHGFVNRNAY
jgi:putative colanic acid biosynthesis UDP-glucose lipid carrier transferase